MKKSIAKIWVAALRSGEFKQGKNVLHDISTNTHCCLGVLSDIAFVKGVCDYSVNNYNNAVYDEHDNDLLCDSVREWSGLKTDNGYTENNRKLCVMNDNGDSFETIANFIEKNYKEL